MKDSRIGLAPKLVLGVSIAVAFANSAMAQTYQDVVLSQDPQYYWTWNDGNADGDNINYGSVGGSGNALSRTSNASDTAPSTVTAGGLSLGNGAVYPGTYSNQGWYTPSPTGSSYSSYAIEFWVELNDTTQTDQYLFASASGLSLIYGFSGNGLELYDGADRTGSDFGTINNGTFTSGQWEEVVLGYEQGSDPGVNDEETLMVTGPDGTTTTTSTGVQGLSYDGSQSVEFGTAYEGGSPMSGAMDEFAVYNLSSATPSEFASDLQDYSSDYYASAVPEPSTKALMLSGFLLSGLLILRRKPKSI